MIHNPILSLVIAGQRVVEISVLEHFLVFKEVKTPMSDVHVCPAGHEIRSRADRDGQGFCLLCRRASNKKLRTRQGTALMLARLLEEEHGIPVTRSTPPVDLKQLAAALASGYRAS